MFDYRAKLSDKPRDTGDDGDTVLLIWDQGRGTHGEEAVRLVGVYAPERGQPGYHEAARFLAETLEEAAERAHAHKRRWPFHLFTEPNTAPEPTERRSFVRYAGTLIIEDTQESVNETMIRFLAAHPQWGKGQT